MQKGALMNISNIMGALFPIFFVLALGYFAGRRNTFDADQAAGFSKLSLSFALPASLFVSMTDIPRDLLLGQGRLVLALILSHVGLFLIAWIALKQIASLHGAQRSSIASCSPLPPLRYLVWPFSNQYWARAAPAL